MAPRVPKKGEELSVHLTLTFHPQLLQQKLLVFTKKNHTLKNNARQKKRRSTTSTALAFPKL